MEPADFAALSAICARVYPDETPYTEAELAEHHAKYPQGQIVAEHLPSRTVAGAHFTLRLRLSDFHVDDPGDVLTAHGTFDDHNPVTGMTLYGADIMVTPASASRIGAALTDPQPGDRGNLWRMVGASGWGHARVTPIERR